MKTKLLSIFLCIPFLFSGCASTQFNSESIKPVINAVVLITANKYAQKNPENLGKILDLATLLEMVADVAANTLSKQDFIDIVSKVDKEWAILGVALYDVYAQNVIIPEKYSKHSVVLKELAATLRDSTLTLQSSK